MKRFYLPLILFFLTIMEGVAFELLPTRLVTSDLLIVPHWVLVFLVYMAVFYDKDTTYQSVIYALVFGLFIDIVYTGVLGIYMFAYAIVIYLAHGLKRMLQGNFYVILLMGILGIMVADTLIYFVYAAIGITDMLWQDYMVSRMLPTILSNLIFVIILYPLVAKRLTRWGREQLTGNSII